MVVFVYTIWSLLDALDDAVPKLKPPELALLALLFPNKVLEPKALLLLPNEVPDTNVLLPNPEKALLPLLLLVDD